MSYFILFGGKLTNSVNTNMNIIPLLVFDISFVLNSFSIVSCSYSSYFNFIRPLKPKLKSKIREKENFFI